MREKINNSNLSIIEKIISKILKKYTYKIYSNGIKDGYNWRNNKVCIKKEKRKDYS